jgi:hemerythrin-like domain-containing protein
MKDLLFAPAASFDSPLEVLHECHERIARNSELIVRIARHLADRGADDEARVAARTALRFFDTAGLNHHLDEEVDLFPALLGTASRDDAARVGELAADLCAEHDRLDALWAKVRAGLVALRDQGEARLAHADADALARAYSEHIAREERELIPLAREILPPPEIERLGRAMAARRTARS